MLAIKFHPWTFVWVCLATAIILFAIRLTAGLPSRADASIATFGAFTACCGVITIGRPMIRVGGYAVWYERSRIIDGGHIEPTPEEITEDQEGRKDAQAVQVSGPLLVLLGTMINGMSGFLA